MAADDTSGTRPAPVVLRIKLRYDDVDAMVQRFAVNVGKSGIFLPTKSLQPIGSEIKFELRLVDDTVVVVGLGRVRAARAPDPQEPKAAFGMAVELLRVTRESRALILRMLERRRQLGLGDIAMPMPEDVDAGRRADVDTSAKESVPQPVPAETASGGESSLLTAPRRPTGPIGEAKEYPIQPLSPEPAKRPRPRISELIAKTRSGPVAAVALPGLDEAVDVASAIARAKALTSGDLDKELESILDQAAAPVEIGVEAASAELARQLGGKAVPRRERSAPRWALPPSVAADAVKIEAPIAETIADAPVEPEAPAVPHDDAPAGGSGDDDAHVHAAVAPDDSAVPQRIPSAQDIGGELRAAVVPDMAGERDGADASVAAPPVEPEGAGAGPSVDVAEPILEPGAAVEHVEPPPEPDPEPVTIRDSGVAEPPVAKRRWLARPLTPESAAFASEVGNALDAIVAKSDGDKPERRSAPKLAVTPKRRSEPRLFQNAEDEVDEALSQLRAVTSDPVPGEPVRETEPFGRVDAEQPDATIDDELRPSRAKFAQAGSDKAVTEPKTEPEPPTRGTLDRIVDELEMDEADRTNVGAMIPDPAAFDHHGYPTEPAVPHDLALDRDPVEAEAEADVDLAALHAEAAVVVGTPPIDDEEFEIEEISDFEIIAEADEEDADLLAADGERDAGQVESDRSVDEISDYGIPVRPSQDFAHRLALDDEEDDFSGGHHAEPSSRHDLSAFDRSDVHDIGPTFGEDSAGFDPISYIGESPNEPQAYDPLSQSYTETADPPAEDSLEFDAPHAFTRKKSHDHELESALKDLEPDLDELAPPYAGAGEVARGRKHVTTGGNRSPASATPPKPAPAAEPAGRQHPRAGTEDGILIDFDDDD